MNKALTGLVLVFILSLPILVQADACVPSTTNPKLCNPLESVAKDLPGAAEFLLQSFGVIIGVTVVIFLMFSGFRMIMSQGNSEEIEKAKSAFQWTLAGFILALFAYIIVFAVSDFIGVNTGDTSKGIPSIDNLNPIASKNFGLLIDRMIKQFLLVVGTLSILLIIIAGYRYITANGNEEQTTQAKNGLLWAIVGLIVTLLAYVITVATATFFGAKVTT